MKLRNKQPEITLSDRIKGLADATELAGGRLDQDAVTAARDALDRAGERRALSADHTVVGFFGATGSGKSTTLAAMIVTAFTFRLVSRLYAFRHKGLGADVEAAVDSEHHP